MERLVEKIEERIVNGILSGKYSPGSFLPLEREWAAALGVGRPTLREALKKLETEGWISSKKGSPSRVNDYLTNGNIEVLARLAAGNGESGKDMKRYYLDFRTLFSPVYFDEALQKNRAKVIALLSISADLEDIGSAHAEYDWKLQTEAASLADNPAYRLLLNTFKKVNFLIFGEYFEKKPNRDFASKYYSLILDAVLNNSNEKAVDLFEELIIENANRWLKG